MKQLRGLYVQTFFTFRTAVEVSQSVSYVRS